MNIINYYNELLSEYESIMDSTLVALDGGGWENGRITEKSITTAAKQCVVREATSAVNALDNIVDMHRYMRTTSENEELDFWNGLKEYAEKQIDK